MRNWTGAGAAAIAFLVGCGNVGESSLVVADSHVVRDGPTGDVAVTWGTMSGLAAWAALDKHRVELIRVRDDGAPLATFHDFPIGAGESTLVRVATTPTGFALVTGQPEALGLLAVMTRDVFVAGSTTLPKAKAIALAPPIVAIVEPTLGALLLGDVGNDSPRTPVAVRDAPQNLLGVGAAFATRNGIVVMVSAHGCVSALSVNSIAKTTGHVSETRCLDGDWDKATAIAWHTGSTTKTEDFAVAVGLTGVIDDEPNATQGFCLDLRVGTGGHLTVLRAAPAPFRPAANAFFGQHDAALQLSGASAGILAARFDADGHPLDPGDTIAWDSAESGGARAVTATSATTWLAMTAENHGASSRVLARAINVQ